MFPAKPSVNQIHKGVDTSHNNNPNHAEKESNEELPSNSTIHSTNNKRDIVNDKSPDKSDGAIAMPDNETTHRASEGDIIATKNSAQLVEKVDTMTSTDSEGGSEDEFKDCIQADCDSAIMRLACGEMDDVNTQGAARKPDLDELPGDALDLGKMKKDDSGIGLEGSKSPNVNSDGDAKIIDVVSDITDGEADVDQPSASNESGFVADIDNEDSEINSALNTSMSHSCTSSSDDSDDSDEEVTSMMQRLRRRRFGTDSSSSDGSHHSTSDARSTTSEQSDVNGAVQVDIDCDPPPDPWHVTEDVVRREYGYSPRKYAAHLFRQRVGSSVGLVRRLEIQHKMDRHEGCVNALHFNASGNLLASGSDDLKIILWDWPMNRPYVRYSSGHRSNVFQSKFMPLSGDCNIVSCARDGQVRLAELSSTGVCRSTRKLAQHKGAAHKLTLLSDSPHVFYTCGEDAVTFQVDVREEKAQKICTTKHNDKKIALYSVHCNPFKSHEFCVAGRDHYIRIYDKRMITERGDEGPLKKFCPHHLIDTDLKANVTCAMYNYNGTEVLGSYNDEDIYLFDNDHSDGADFIKRYKGHRNNATVKGVNFFGPRSEFVVSGSDCRNVFIWDKMTEKIINFFPADEGGVVNVLEPHPSLPILATSGLDHDVKIWSPTAKEPSKLLGLKQLIRRNTRERDDDRSNEPDMVDGQMLWMLMQHLRRTSRRMGQHGDADNSDDNNSSDSNSGSDINSSDSDEMHEPMQCAPS